ncbi:hypothetical protein TWF225_006896 [Orbilia oligospora]|uniref:F-box domain-containing protein n=1 Tax=Orbilia oligospora TaxID=2813651 RepID=A0A8H2HRE3_ORBOL|nr:hypothetical protein TWF225_006896 [Orbilia oligospora]KAF3246232.1 hypothetical protein TWF128_009039 [Orbilia oligospora]KAF3264100.1 hypothetical protein TWF217_003257 [Orbilia oligospora]KAF3296151.1 hypothetical protein TWF132_011614 [Orbilia oligospora]TGJ68523.1 hypothetical protein EYR41_007569 [Orbilia oligospora]
MMMEGIVVRVQKEQSSNQRSVLLQAPAEVLEDIIEYIPKESLSPLSQTCKIFYNLVTPTLYPRTLKLFILRPEYDWRNGHHHFTYPAKRCEQGYLDDKKSEKILNAPAGWLKHVKEFIVVDSAHRYDDVCWKRKHKGLKRPDEVVLTMILKRLGMLAKGLKSVVIPRDIPLRMFVTILESIPNLCALEAVIEPRTFYRESRNRLPYKSLLTTVTSLDLERLRFGFSDEKIVSGMFRILERCCTTLRSLEISASFYDKVDFNGLEKSGDEGSDYERPKLKFSALEKLKIDMNRDGSFADWLLRLSTDFRKLSSLAIHAGQDTQEIVKYLISNGAPIHSLQLTDLPEKAYCVNPEGDERRVNKLLETIDHLDTLQLWSFDGWDLKTVYDTHRHTLKKLWLNCHISHNLEPGQTCAVEDKLFRSEVDRYAFTTENWPVLEELTMPWLGIDKLPMHLGLRVLRLEHLHTKSATRETYKSLLEPYITSLLKYAAPAKPKLEVIVIMPNTYDRAYEGHDMTYLSIGYDENGADVTKAMNYMVDILKKHKWSYLFQEKTLARLWDDRGIWDLHSGNYYEGSS